MNTRPSIEQKTQQQKKWRDAGTFEHIPENPARFEACRKHLLERKLGEQLGQREAEAGEHIFAFEGVGHAQEAVSF